MRIDDRVRSLPVNARRQHLLELAARSPVVPSATTRRVVEAVDALLVGSTYQPTRRELEQVVGAELGDPAA